jgi:plastocyanin
MKRFRIISILLALVTAFAGLAMPAAVYAQAPASSSPQTYTVTVGAERVSFGIDVEAYFPQTLRIHVWDKVVWKVNSFEIHTVTFLPNGMALPPLLVPFPPGPAGALMLNQQVAFPAAPANGQYDSSKYANSGILSLDTGQARQFSLIFPTEGTFQYVCAVHGVLMSGTIKVVGASVWVPSPEEVSEQALALARSRLAHALPIYFEALSKVPPPTRNSDGTKTYHVLMGYAKGDVDLMDFFPRRLTVHPGDTVDWTMSPSNMAPHTVSFLNGAAEPPLVVLVPNPPSPLPYLVINPDLAMPHQYGQPLTRSGVFSTGLMAPGMPAMSFKIGNISGKIAYECEVHDASGMKAILNVVPRK